LTPIRLDLSRARLVIDETRFAQLPAGRECKRALAQTGVRKDAKRIAQRIGPSVTALHLIECTSLPTDGVYQHSAWLKFAVRNAVVETTPAAPTLVSAASQSSATGIGL
jgi:hypothetical protein